jgi:hypothetical protein
VPEQGSKEAYKKAIEIQNNIFHAIDNNAA